MEVIVSIVFYQMIFRVLFRNSSRLGYSCLIFRVREGNISSRVVFGNIQVIVLLGFWIRSLCEVDV